MRKILNLTAIAACAIATPALAQDEDGSWTGAYVGVNAGYTDATSDQTVVLGGNWTTESAALQTRVTTDYPTNSKVQDINYGAQIGYNVQAGSSLVIGVEADVSALSGKEALSHTSAGTPSYTIANTFDPKVTYSVKGKVGIAAGNTLFYATGGWGWTQADLATDITSSGGYHKASSFSHTFDGYEVGGGLEHRFGSNVSLRVEYIYTDQGDVTYTTGYVTGSAFTSPAYTETFTQDLTMHLVRVGINLHF